MTTAIPLQGTAANIPVFFCSFLFFEYFLVFQMQSPPCLPTSELPLHSLTHPSILLLSARLPVMIKFHGLHADGRWETERPSNHDRLGCINEWRLCLRSSILLPHPCRRSYRVLSNNEWSLLLLIRSALGSEERSTGWTWSFWLTKFDYSCVCE